MISIGCLPDHQGDDKSISYHRLSLLANPDVDMITVIKLATAIINDAKLLEKVLVHCAAAISHSPAVLAGYLMPEEGMSLRETLGMLARAKSRARPNDGFLRQLREVEIRIGGSASIEVDALPTAVKERLRLLGVK
jgi:predicted protein tyrosine phosphatase